MIGLIGGTGLGEQLFGTANFTEHNVETPFGRPSSPIRVTEWHGLRVALLARHGAGHLLNPTSVPYRANIYALKSLGVTHIIASGAVGSLREEIRPRELVIVDQVIDRTTKRASTFFDEGLTVHVEFAHPFCPDLRGRLIEAAANVNCKVHERGTYVCIEGPAFSSVAESNMHRQWGADVVGMTCLPEARLAREAEMCYALVALATDYDCWRPHAGGVSKDQLLREIIGNLDEASSRAILLIRAAIESISRVPLGASPIHDAIELAIWSDKDRIKPEAAKRYGALLAKYFA